MAESVYDAECHVWRDVDGRAHRIGGPAYTSPRTGYCIYYEHGLIHNDNGPAIVYGTAQRPDNPDEYCLRGNNYTKAKWEEKRSRPHNHVKSAAKRN